MLREEQRDDLISHCCWGLGIFSSVFLKEEIQFYFIKDSSYQYCSYLPSFKNQALTVRGDLVLPFSKWFFLPLRVPVPPFWMWEPIVAS